MTPEDVEALSHSSPEVHFMDLTDYPEPIMIGKTFDIPTFPTHQTVVNPLLDQVDEDNIVYEIGALSSYTTRYYTSQTGVAAVNYWASQYQYYGGGRNDVEVELFVHSQWPQRSVIARIYGTTHPDEVVVLGGHIDSTSSGATAPGADDDASGSSTNIEVFRTLIDSGFRPERTIEFHAYSAEEVGLRGSQDIATSYANRGINVVAMLQFDMTGYSAGSSTPTIGVVTDFTHTGLTAFVRALIDEYITERSPNRWWTNTACGYACSDHASWFRSGYPDAFVFESTFGNSNPYIHTPNDQLNRLNAAHMRLFAELGVAFAVELSFSEDK